MKKLKLNKKIVNAFIGFIGFALILSLSSCKCSGSSVEEPGITSEIADGDKTISSTLDNSEAGSEVSSEEITNENSSEEAGEVLDTNGNGVIDYEENFYNVYRDDVTEEQIEETNKLINEYRELFSDDPERTNRKHEVYDAFLKTYDMEKIIDMINNYRYTDFTKSKVGYYAKDKNLNIDFCSNHIIIYYLDDASKPIFVVDQFADDDMLFDYSYFLHLDDDTYLRDIRINYYLAGLSIAGAGDLIDNSYLEEGNIDLTEDYIEYNKKIIKKLEKPFRND